MRFTDGLRLLALTSLLGACSTLENIGDVFQSEPPVAATEPAAADAGAVAETAPLENPSLAQQALVDSDTRQRYLDAVQLLQQDKLLQAKVAFQDLHKDFPDYSGPLVNLGIIAEAEGDADAALIYYADAISANASNQQAYNRQGLLLRKRGEFDAAEASYLAAIAQWPSYAPIRLNLGILYDVYMGRLVDAAEQYQAYQDLQETPDRLVKAWQADLGRRVQAMLEQQP